MSYKALSPEQLAKHAQTVAGHDSEAGSLTATVGGVVTHAAVSTAAEAGLTALAVAAAPETLGASLLLPLIVAPVADKIGEHAGEKVKTAINSKGKKDKLGPAFDTPAA